MTALFRRMAKDKDCLSPFKRLMVIAVTLALALSFLVLVLGWKIVLIVLACFIALAIAAAGLFMWSMSKFVREERGTNE